MKYLTCTTAAICAVFCIVASAGNITLPDNRVLENAYVMSERPDGLEIGHKNGVMFVDFTDLPVAIQKKYNYSPEKAAKYRSDIAAAKVKRAQDQAKRKADMEKAFAEDQKRTADMQFDQLGVEIQKYQSRIEFLSSDIPRLEKSYTELLSKSSQLSVDNADTNTYYGGDCYWGSGFLTTGGAQATKKKQAVKKLSDQAADTKDELESDKQELQEKQSKLAVMKIQYDKLKDQRAAENK